MLVIGVFLVRPLYMELPASFFGVFHLWRHAQESSSDRHIQASNPVPKGSIQAETLHLSVTGIARTTEYNCYFVVARCEIVLIFRCRRTVPKFPQVPLTCVEFARQMPLGAKLTVILPPIAPEQRRESRNNETCPPPHQGLPDSRCSWWVNCYGRL